MPPHITLWNYLWDLVDDGIDEVLYELKNDLGMTALSVATHYHSVDHLRPHTKGKFIYRSDSALYFQPDTPRWKDVPIEHQVSPVAQGNPLKQVAQRANAIGLDLVSWTICCHSSWLGRTFPECAQQNAMGDRYPEALCPANPAVRAFLKALVDDLSHNYGISLAELESCHYQNERHYHHHEKFGLDAGPVGTLLLGMCFCEHCERRAKASNVDVERLRGRFVEQIRKMATEGEGPAGDVESFVACTPGLPEYVAMREAVVTSLIAEMGEASAAPLSPIVWSGLVDTGVNGQALAETAGSITIAAYHTDVEDVRAAIEDAAAMAGGADKLRVGYHTYPPITPDRETLLRNIEASLDLGVRAFSFYHYGIAPRRSLGWVRHAAELIHRRSG